VVGLVVSERQTLEVVIVGKPVSKARPRFGRGRAYTPKTTVDAEKAVRVAYWQSSVDQFGRVVMFDGDITINLVFGLGDRRRRDWDNLAKLVCDALNGIAYRDDAQIHRAVVDKLYTDTPYTKIIINGRIEP
jgi:Holliday junction resolvase RusA-like endonuclease